MLVLALLVVACKSNKPITTVVLKKEKASFLVKKLAENQKSFKTFKAKARMSVKFEGTSNTVTSTLKMRKDSLIWMSVSPALGIEVARVMLSMDSIKLIDRFHGQYMLADYSFLNKKYNVPADFLLAQSVLLGSVYKINNKNVHASIEGQHYRLTSDTEDQLIDIWINPVSYSIHKISILDKNLQLQFTTVYDDYRMVDEFLFPHLMNLSVDKMGEMSTQIKYSNVKFDEPLSFPFTIPSKYQRTGGPDKKD